MDNIRAARIRLKWELKQRGTRCACGAYGATDLGHIVYTRHPDMVELYHPLNMVLLHNSCNTNEHLWINVNACLMLLERAGGPETWEEWARTIPRKGDYWIPDKMQIAMGLWDGGLRAFDKEVKKAVDILTYGKPPIGRSERG